MINRISVKFNEEWKFNGKFHNGVIFNFVNLLL